MVFFFSKEFRFRNNYGVGKSGVIFVLEYIVYAAPLRNYKRPFQLQQLIWCSRLQFVEAHWILVEILAHVYTTSTRKEIPWNFSTPCSFILPQIHCSCDKLKCPCARDDHVHDIWTCAHLFVYLGGTCSHCHNTLIGCYRHYVNSSCHCLHTSNQNNITSWNELRFVTYIKDEELSQYRNRYISRTDN